MGHEEQGTVAADVVELAGVTWPRQALARMALSGAAAEAAQIAAELVPTVADRAAREGELVEQARRLVSAAAHVLERAVIYERGRGAAWHTIGTTLGTTAQRAHDRYGPEAKHWDQILDEPYIRGTDGLWECELTDGLDQPEEHIRRLDRWCIDHGVQPLTPDDPADQLVSAGLPHHTPATASVLPRDGHLRPHDTTDDPTSAQPMN